jgi:hypothetical protein
LSLIGKNTAFLGKEKEMTQRIFDIENKKDMQDLWEILPEGIERIVQTTREYNTLWSKSGIDYACIKVGIILINWHDKTEITRPIQEATGKDVGKLCKFWDFDDGERKYGILRDISSTDKYQMYSRDGYFNHARRLTKQEIEELC